MGFQIPVVTMDDLCAFHAQCLSPIPAPDRSLPIYEPGTVEEQDGLGYYSDGTKCTLTEADIAYLRLKEIKAILDKRRPQRGKRDISEEGESQDSPCEGATPSQASGSPATTDVADIHARSTSTSTGTSIAQDHVRSGRVGKPKTQQWATTSARTKAKNKKNRNKYKAKKREERLKKERAQREGRVEGQGSEESDEWDPWHQANGPDVQQDKPLDLDY